MIEKIVFATNNAHKLDELRKIVAGRFDVLSLGDIGCVTDIPENEPTLQGNAMAKARWICDRYNIDTIADDTGLEVDALNGAPGVHSARFAPGTDHDASANMHQLLTLMANTPTEQRSARFRTVIAFLRPTGTTFCVEGRVEGKILRQPQGEGGFGYDPVFVPDGYNDSFGTLPASVKNTISHRARACHALIAKLQELGIIS